jgi:hypothetical protein
MKRCLALIFVPLIAGAAEPPLALDFVDLVKHPQRYDGRRVAVRAYALTSLYECSEFWPSREAARRGHLRPTTSEPCIAIGRVAAGYALPKSFATRLFKLPPRREGYDGYVHVVGTFRYVDLTPAPTPRAKKLSGPPERVVVMQTMGFGTHGVYDKTITDMTECTPIGPPLPSGLKD